MDDDSRVPPDADIDKWRVVSSALESWSRTARLCVICLVMSVPLVCTIIIWVAIRHLSQRRMWGPVIAGPHIFCSTSRPRQ